MARLKLNSLVPKIDQLRLFCSQHRVDVMAVNETKVDSIVSDGEII